LALTTQVKGLQINYTVKGSGDYIFLLPGWGSSLELFAELAEVLAEKYTVVSVDFPGFGKSEEPPKVWSVSDYADFTVEFIKQFACEKVILLGHSFGGRVIIKIANLNNLPFRIEKNLLVSSAGILPKRSLKFKIKLRIYKIGKLFLNTPLLKKMFPAALEKHKQRLGSPDYANASETMRGILVKAVNEDLEPLLKNIKSQTLLIWGENDTATPLADGQKMEKIISEAGTDVGLVVLKGAGHFSFIEQRYAFHKVVKSFLKIGA
jgi:pimeloyl-ACP methyl ester carboxylesterase